MPKPLNEESGLTRSDRELLRQIEAALPLLSDLSRADLLLYLPTGHPGTAVVSAQARPAPVAPVFDEGLVGTVVEKKSEPAVFQVLTRGRSARVFNSRGPSGAPTVQEVVPVRSGNRLIGALSIESNLLEYERMRKKSPVFRKALERIQEMALHGRLASAASLSRLGEHDGLLVVDQKGIIQYISGIAENLYRKLGHTGSLLSIPLQDLDGPETLADAAMAQGRCLEREASIDGLVWIRKAIPIVCDAAAWRSGQPERLAGALVVIQDITDERTRELALRVKTAMIKEIHHRVKNNLQTIAALLRLQARRTDNPDVTRLLQDSVNRILSVAVVHEFLSHDEDAIINIREVCARIVSEVTQGILDPDKRIRIVLEGENVYLPAQQATSIALVVNELLQNAVKHGYVGREEGVITVRLAESATQITIEIADDGAGLPPEMSVERDGNLGMQIVRTLVREDLRGEFHLTSHNGTTARVVLPRLGSRQRMVQTA
ncbi:MAG: sensor histidine kinase [Chloroflexota bacterium]|nr:sensor histidine kinase [Dehalococcoidia bacterium]MDW8253361.1 sensor histidine kinase [Chloroflexota bacterium]